MRFLCDKTGEKRDFFLKNKKMLSFYFVYFLIGAAFSDAKRTIDNAHLPLRSRRLQRCRGARFDARDFGDHNRRSQRQTRPSDGRRFLEARAFLIALECSEIKVKKFFADFSTDSRRFWNAERLAQRADCSFYWRMIASACTRRLKQREIGA